MLREIVFSAITFYCPCVKCVGPNVSHGLTSSGVYPEEGWTLACPRGWKGRMIWMEGVGVGQCEDTGSAITGRRVDVFVRSHSEALHRGILRKVRGFWWNP